MLLYAEAWSNKAQMKNAAGIFSLPACTANAYEPLNSTKPCILNTLMSSLCNKAAALPKPATYLFPSSASSLTQQESCSLTLLPLLCWRCLLLSLCWRVHAAQQERGLTFKDQLLLPSSLHLDYKAPKSQSSLPSFAHSMAYAHSCQHMRMLAHLHIGPR